MGERAKGSDGGAGVKVGFVGAGAMGAPMVGRLVGAGHDVTVFARRAATRTRVAQLGGRDAGSLAAAAQGAEVVVVCVLTDDQVADVAEGQGGLVAAMEPGSTLVVHTTGDPATARRLGTAGAGRGVAVVDAPVSGTVADVEAGTITLLLGGEDEAVARCRPVLAAYGDPLFHMGPLGSGQAAKLVNNALLAAHVQLAVDAVRLAGVLGIDPAALLEAVLHCSGSSWALRALVGAGSVDELAARMGPFLRKDLDTVTSVASSAGAELGLLGRTAREGPLDL